MGEHSGISHLSWDFKERVKYHTTAYCSTVYLVYCCLMSFVVIFNKQFTFHLMSSPMVALVVRELVMLMYNQRLNERGAVSWDLDYLHSANATKINQLNKTF